MTRTVRVASLPASSAALSLVDLNWPRPAARPQDKSTNAPSAARLDDLKSRVNALLAEISDLERQAASAAPTTVSASLITLMGKLRRGELTDAERQRVVAEIAEHERKEAAASAADDGLTPSQRLRLAGMYRRGEPQDLIDATARRLKDEP